MILLREVEHKDLEGLDALAKIAAERHPGFLNIANDQDQWKEKVQRSILSFSDKLENKIDGKYIFVAEDLEKKRILGLSMIATQHGTPETPHFFFEIGSEKKYSESMNTGFIHGTLKLKYDTNGPSEIGGLLVDPDYRNSPEKIGRQISFVRFLYLGLHKNKFKRRVLAELLPPLTKKGKSPLWEAVGRRFTNMDYTEADNLSSKNKEFILSLFPTGKIYITFLAAEARNAIGKVSKETEPVLHMLKKIGFQYRNQVDPFDGGPHVSANVDEILPIKHIKQYSISFHSTKDVKTLPQQSGLITPVHKSAKFAAISVNVFIDQKNMKIYFFDQAREDYLAQVPLNEGDLVYFMSYY